MTKAAAKKTNKTAAQLVLDEIAGLCVCRTEEARAKRMKGVWFEDSPFAERANKGGRMPARPAWGGRNGVSSLWGLG